MEVYEEADEPTTTTTVQASTLTAATSLAGLLFWSTAPATDACARRAVRCAWLYLLHPAYVALAAARAGAGPAGGCAAATWAQLMSEPAAFAAELGEGLRAQSPQGMMDAGQLVGQLAIACVALYIVIDAPDATRLDGALWGPRD